MSSVTVFAIQKTSKGLIDLGSGEVESDIQGSQYLLRIRGSLEERIQNMEDVVDEQAFKEIENRHLQILLNSKKETTLMEVKKR